MNLRFILKTVSLTILILSNVISTSFAQSKKTPLGASKQAKPEDAKLVKDRILLVRLLENQLIDERLRKDVKSFWKYNSDIKFLTNDEIVSAVKDNETKYAILTIDVVNVFTNSLNPGPANQFVRFSIMLGEKLNKTRPVFYQDVIPEVQSEKFDLNQREIIFSIRCIQNHLIARTEGKTRLFFTWEVAENFGKLETKILLVDEKFMAKDFTAEDFKANYPYQFKITDINFIEKALNDKDKKYAYVERVPSGTSSSALMHYIVDCENGQTLSYGDFFNGAFDGFSNSVNKKQVKCYAKNSVDRKRK